MKAKSAVTEVHAVTPNDSPKSPVVSVEKKGTVEFISNNPVLSLYRFLLILFAVGYFGRMVPTKLYEAGLVEVGTGPIQMSTVDGLWELRGRGEFVKLWDVEGRGCLTVKAGELKVGRCRFAKKFGFKGGVLSTKSGLKVQTTARIGWVDIDEFPSLV